MHIKFDEEFGQAFILQSTLEETGWIVKYDKNKKLFSIWEYNEAELLGFPPDVEVDSLEDVLSIVSKYT